MKVGRSSRARQCGRQHMLRQAAGLIRYSRGHIAVVDRPDLDRRTCACHAVVKKEYDRLLAELLAV